MSDTVERLRAALDKAEAQLAQCSPGPWFFGGYAGVFSKPKVAEWDPWLDGIADDHSLDRGACPECGGESCRLAAEAYRREPVVAHTPAQYGDTATGEHAVDAQHIARWDPSTVLKLIQRDRALLAAHVPRSRSRINCCFSDGHFWPCPEIKAAAEFWLSQEGE